MAPVAREVPTFLRPCSSTVDDVAPKGPARPHHDGRSATRSIMGKGGLSATSQPTDPHPALPKLLEVTEAPNAPATPTDPNSLPIDSDRVYYYFCYISKCVSFFLTKTTERILYY